MPNHQQRHTPSPTRRPQPTTGSKPPRDLQSVMGNSATRDLQEQGGPEAVEEEKQGDVWGWIYANTGWGWSESLSNWWGDLWGKEQDLTHGPLAPHLLEASVGTDEDTPVLEPQVDRIDAVVVGMKGAVIADGNDIQVRGEPGKDASVTGTIPDGKPVEVLDVSGKWIQIEYRVAGNKEEQGWVKHTVFSDQPGIFMDEDHPGMMEDHIWQLHEKEQILPEAGQLKGTEISQGGLADCYFIAAMIAVGNARPQFLEESFRYNQSTGLYEVRFFEAGDYDWENRRTNYKEVWVEVDGYLPSDGDRTAYARANPALWGALMEKAYAKWQGGFDAIGDGGVGSQAMQHIAGADSSTKSPSRMSPEEVLEFFTQAQQEGKAIYAGTQSSWASEKQTPLSGSAAGPFTGTVAQIHQWNSIKPGSLRIVDTGDGMGGTAFDTGQEGSKTARITGGGVSEGEVDYSKPGSISVTYREDAAPQKAQDLEVGFDFKGMIAPQYQLVGWHGYAFKEIVDGKLQFHNPWGSWQPKAITPEDFTKYFSSCATNLVPQAKAAQEADD